MNYIVLDLEWNQSPAGKSGENRAIPFEIIEIGAVKLDASRKITDRFHACVRPQVYRNLHFKTQELIHISMGELNSARSFREVAEDFFCWCGEDYRMCTWGTMDLEELQRNMDYYQMENPFPRPLLFYDIQKLFSRMYEDGHIRRSLEYAVEYLQFPKTLSFHRAFEDTCYTAMVMQMLDWDQVKEYLSVDYHRPPQTREDEIYLQFSDYAKYVSRPFSTKEDMMKDKAVTATPCCVCGRSLRRKIRWFPSGSKTYDSLSWCPEHGYMKGKIRLKKTGEEESCYAIKILRMASDEDVEIVREKRDHLRAKRRTRRKHKKGA